MSARRTSASGWWLRWNECGYRASGAAPLFGIVVLHDLDFHDDQQVIRVSFDEGLLLEPFLFQKLAQDFLARQLKLRLLIRHEKTIERRLGSWQMGAGVLIVQVLEFRRSKHVTRSLFELILVSKEIRVAKDDDVLLPWKCLVQRRQLLDQLFGLGLPMRPEVAAPKIGLHVNRDQHEVGLAS